MDNKNDILKMLRDREDEFRLLLREDGWERLETEMVTRTVVRWLSWRWWAVAVVVLMCLMLSVPLFIPEETFVSDSEIRPEKIEPELAKKHPDLADKRDVNRTPVSRDKKPMKNTKRTVSIPWVAYKVSVFFDSDTLVVLPEPIKEDSLLMAIVSQISVLSEQNDSASDKVKSPKRKDFGPQPDKTYLQSLRTVENEKIPNICKDTHGWSVGLMAGSNTMAISPGSVYFDHSFTDPGDNKPEPDPDPEDPDKGKKEFRAPRKAGPGNTEDGGSTGTTRYYYRHRMPITASLSVRRNLSPQIALESGISYTYLYSDYYEENKHIGEQQLHYIGVPLKINWIFLNKGAMSLYLSAGGMLEYCLSARSRNNILGNTMDIYPWQASLNAGAGLQVALVKPLSLFVEPGVGYYFNTINYGRRNRIETIRTIHPVTFNLQVGIRLSY